DRLPESPPAHTADWPAIAGPSASNWSRAQVKASLPRTRRAPSRSCPGKRKQPHVPASFPVSPLTEVKATVRSVLLTEMRRPCQIPDRLCPIAPRTVAGMPHLERHRGTKLGIPPVKKALPYSSYLAVPGLRNGDRRGRNRNPRMRHFSCGKR